MLVVSEDFSTPLAPHWRRYLVGAGALEPTDSTLRFILSDAARRKYSDAQIDDYQGLSRRRFLWRPPLRLTVRARFPILQAPCVAQRALAFGTTPS